MVALEAILSPRSASDHSQCSIMELAVEAARTGDLLYFTSLPADQLVPLLKRRDEDLRSLLHTACGSGNLQLVQFLLDHGASQVNDPDEEVRTLLLSLLRMLAAAARYRCLLPGAFLPADCPPLELNQSSPCTSERRAGRHCIQLCQLGTRGLLACC